VECLEDRLAPAAFTVTNANDGGPGSLRAAVAQANSLPGGDAIVFAPQLARQTISLTTADDTALGRSALVVTDPLSIIGSGQTITRGGSAPLRLFRVTISGSLVLRNLTLSNGLAQGGSGGAGGGGAAGLGGAVYAQGTFSAFDTSFIGNRAVGGAGGAAVNNDSGGGGGGLLLAGATGHLDGGLGGGPNPGSAGLAAGAGLQAGGPGGAGGLGGGGGGGGTGDIAGGAGGVGGFGGGGGGGSAAFGSSIQPGNPGGGGGKGGFGGGGGGGGKGVGAFAALGGAGGFGGSRGGQGTVAALEAAGFGGGGGGGAGMGGAVFDEQAVITLYRCTLAGNTAQGGAGGAAGTGAAAVTAGSAGGGAGGAVFNLGGAVHVTDCTFAGNTAAAGPSGNAGFGAGGSALYNLDGTEDITASTVAGNATTAGAGGAGVIVVSQDSGIPGVGMTAAATLVGDVLANTTGGPDLVCVGGPSGGSATVTATAPNLVRTKAAFAGGTVTGTPLTADPLLDPLRDNGGPTLTMALRPGSPALGVGTASGTPVFDQRGAARDHFPDLGAYEAVSPLTPVGVPVDALFGPAPDASANEALVKGLYHTILMRDADPAALQALVPALAGGQITQQQLAAGLYNSTEARQKQATTFYRQILRRDPDPAGLQAMTQALQAGVDEASLMVGLFASAEFASTNDNGAFLTALYGAALGRNPDPTGFNAAKSLLDGNQITRQQLAQSFLRSTEGAQRVVDSYFQTYLRRSADPAALAAVAQSIQAGTHYGTFAVIILGSPEFAADAAAAVP
jgi:hypothetical protein